MAAASQRTADSAPAAKASPAMLAPLRDMRSYISQLLPTTQARSLAAPGPFNASGIDSLVSGAAGVLGSALFGAGSGAAAMFSSGIVGGVKLMRRF